MVAVVPKVAIVAVVTVVHVVAAIAVVPVELSYNDVILFLLIIYFALLYFNS